ncbi:CBN-ATG-13 protein [Caenorhabditis brenneri]|uniref:CBN-ATG-13 protein n=1 Tax=Caenorhabditis brenneri TaxID=135651 RepID=G0N5E6_CAEBE|nr:CBN-ATG-13 protein [Caenorhabditis brenneri]
MDEEYAMYKKYIRFFAVRMVQSLIQARLGDEVESKCSPYSVNTMDWFNMRVDELGEISAYLKSNIKNYPPTSTLTLEFLLYTPSGQCLPLEAWILSCSEGSDDCSRSELYHEMSTLLRSVIVSARMTPMHRLYVKKQNLESFVIMYRVFENDISSDFGKGKKTRKIGELSSKFGNISLDLHYRTSMHFEEPEIAPLTPVEDEEETKDLEKTVVDESLETKVETRAVSECIPIADAKKRKASGSVESATSGGSSASREAAPRFVLGQSTSSEDSRHSDLQNSYDDDHKPSLADLRNHSFPFVNLLQSAYNPANGTKKNASTTCLNSPKAAEEAPTVEKVAESFRAAKIDEVVIEEDEEEELPLDSMELSEDSFVHFNQPSDFGGAPSLGNELGDYLKQLKMAPEMSEPGEIDICKMDLKTELEKINAQTANFNNFLRHVNSFSDE